MERRWCLSHQSDLLLSNQSRVPSSHVGFRTVSFRRPHQHLATFSQGFLHSLHKRGKGSPIWHCLSRLFKELPSLPQNEHAVYILLHASKARSIPRWYSTKQGSLSPKIMARNSLAAWIPLDQFAAYFDSSLAVAPLVFSLLWTTALVTFSHWENQTGPQVTATVKGHKGEAVLQQNFWSKVWKPTFAEDGDFDMPIADLLSCRFRSTRSGFGLTA